MRFFLDHHHYALARSLLTTLCGRLGHEVWFPDIPFVKSAVPPTVWNVVHPIWFDEVMVDPAHVSWAPHGVVSEEEFFDLDWDFLVASRSESQEPILRLKRKHPRGDRIRLLAVSGNAGTVYDRERFEHLVSTDEGSARLKPNDLHVICVPQEIGWAYSSTSFAPMRPEALRRVASYVHNLAGWHGDWNYDAFGGGCPHCGTSLPGADRDHVRPELTVVETWRKLRSLLPRHELLAFGGENEVLGGRLLHEKEIPSIIDSTALTVHWKSSEGFGHSLLQSVRRGRLVVVPERFYRYKMANRYLIPDVTCLEVPWDARAVARAVEGFTRDLDVANERSLRCREVADVLFDPEYDTRRLGRWLDEIVKGTKT